MISKRARRIVRGYLYEIFQRRQATADLELITRYICGECGPEEELVVRDRLEHDAHFKEYVEPILWGAAAARRHAQAQRRLAAKTAAWETFRTQAIADDPEAGALLPVALEPTVEDAWAVLPKVAPPTLFERFSDFMYEWPRLSRFVSIMLVVGLGVGLSWLSYKNVYLAQVPAVDYSQTAPLGGTATMLLPDGSRALLASGSTLGYDDVVPASGVRELVLSGEVFLRTGANPLTVVLTDHRVAVLSDERSAAFDVRGYADDSMVRVVVTEGAVHVGRWRDDAIDANASPVLVGAGQEVFVTREAISTARATADSLGWRDGVLSYRQVPLGDILRDIQHWYGAPFRWGPDASSLAGVRVSARIVAGTPVDDVLIDLSRITNMRLKRGSSGIITIQPWPREDLVP